MTNQPQNHNLEAHPASSSVEPFPENAPQPSLSTEAELRRANRALRMLSDCNQILIRAANETNLLNNICQIIVEVGGYRMAWVGFARHDEARQIEPVAHAGFEDGYLALLKTTWTNTDRGRGPTGTAIRTGRPSIARNIATDPNFAPWRDEAMRRGYAASIALPLIDNTQVLGQLSIYSAEADVFDPLEVELLTELANDLTFGLITLRARAEREQAVAALRESEERYRQLYERSPLGYLSLDANGCFIEVNQAWSEALGYSPQEVLGRWFGDFIAPHQVEAFRQRFPYFKSVGSIHTEFEMRRKDGSSLIMTFDGRIGHDEKGEFKQTHCILTDITEQKRVEQEIRLNQDRLNRAQAVGHVGSWEYDLKTGYIWGSEEGFRIYGMEPSTGQLPIDRIEACIPEREMVHQALVDLIAELKPYNLEFTINPADGSPPRVITSVAELQLDDQANPERVVGVIQDITERKRIEAALQESQEKASFLAKLLENSSQPFAIGYFDGRVGIVNSAFLILTGYSRAELANLDWARSLTPPEWLPAEQARLAELQRTGQPVRYQKEYIRKDGSRVPIELFVHLARDEQGQMQYYYAFLTDITERQRTEQQLRASLQEKEQLLRELYHRTKNNMQVITSMLSLRARSANNPLVHKIFQEIQTRILSMAMVHEKLYQSQNLSSISLDSYIADLAKLLLATYRVKPNKITLSLNLEPISTLIDTAIPCGLVLNELISNALEHAFPDKRAGEIQINLHRTAQGEINLEVADNGVGVPAGFDLRNTGTFGLPTALAIAEYQLQGQVVFATENGVKCQIHFRDDLYQERV